MPIEKIIKRYFVFVMLLSGLAFLNANDGIHALLKNSYTSVIHSLDGAFFDRPVQDAELAKLVVQYQPKLKNDLTVDMHGGTFGRAKEHGLPLLELSFHGGDSVLDLSELDFEASMPGIEAMYLSDGADYWKEADQDGNLWHFDGLKQKIDGTLDLGLVLDLDEELKPGDRIRVDLVGAGELKSNLFLRGKYVTIVR